MILFRPPVDQMPLIVRAPAQVPVDVVVLLIRLQSKGFGGGFGDVLSGYELNVLVQTLLAVPHDVDSPHVHLVVAGVSRVADVVQLTTLPALEFIQHQIRRGQPVRRAEAFDTGRRASRRKSPVSAGFQGRLFGIPISGKAAIIILIILVIVCIILNKTGVLD